MGSVQAGLRGCARLAKIIREISGCTVVRFSQEPAAAVMHVIVRQGKDVGTFDLDLTDVAIEDEHLLRILLEQRLDGLREWAHWEERAKRATRHG